MTETKINFISFMIESNVLKFGNFVTKSKRKTPYFIDTGNFKTGKQIKILGEFYADLIKNSGCEFDLMFGPAYKGIPLVVCCSSALYEKYGIDRPFVFNRKEVKDHGEGGELIGQLPQKNDKLIIIEDVLTAGTAIKETIPLINPNNDIKCTEMFVAVNRCEIGKTENISAADEIKQKFAINVNSIINIYELKNYLEQTSKYKKYAVLMAEYIEKYCK